MNFFDSKIFGSIPSPESIEDLLSLVRKHASERRNVYFWRGQGNIEWPIHSSAYRRLKIDNNEITEKDMRRYEESLLEHATHQGYRYDSGRYLSDFELLAKLQHHGAATRLIDCSRNILVGLWFACMSERESNGLLFGYHSDFVGGNENKSENRRYLEVCNRLNTHNNCIVWQPPMVTKRIASQNAQFLFSLVVDKPTGSLIINGKPDSHIAINITPSFKEKALIELSETFDIRYLTLFPDIDGFGYVHSFRFSKYEHQRW